MTEPSATTTSKAAKTAAASGAVLSLGAALVGQLPASAGPPTPDVTNPGDTGAGTLRDAIDDANAAPGPDTITFAAGLGTITLDSEIVISDELTILGPATVSGGGDSRIFYINTAGAVTISGLTLQDGSATEGGAINVEDVDAFSLQSSTISGSDATSGNGGGILIGAGADLEIIDSTFTGNTASGDGGGAYIHTDEEALVISGSTFAGNTAGDYGGGFMTRHVYDVQVDTTTVSGNTAANNGGGAHFHAHSDTALSVTSSTFSGNTSGEYGGGIFVYDFGYADISHTTVAGNEAAEGGGIWLDSINNESTLSHVLVGDNTAPASPDFGTLDTVTLIANSLVEVDPDPGSIDDQGGNVFGEDAALAPLADNGGPNMTRALGATSPALDGGDPGFAPPPDTDQRGLPRVQGEAIDIGAYEAQPEEPVPPTEPPTEPPAARPATGNPTFTG
jgi:predicted outer membrane repeat protein